jgi:type I restriction enzyme M protein
VLFRGQPEVEEETGEFDTDGNPKMKRRKADDEHLIRQALLEGRLIDAVISLPLNVFYGAGLPACLLILRKDRSRKRHDHVLLIYAARHYRELSNQNQLRPQDVMRMLVHYHAYGDVKKVPVLVRDHSRRIHDQIDQVEREEIERLQAVYNEFAEKLEQFDRAIQDAKAARDKQAKKADKKPFDVQIHKLEKQRSRPAAKIAERDERIAEVQRRAANDRQDVTRTGEELVALYQDPDELLKHARVVGLDEVEENEFNLNIPRYVDTFEPEPKIKVKDALKALAEAQTSLQESEQHLLMLLEKVGYETD